MNNQDAILKYVLSQPNLAEQVARQFSSGLFNVPVPMESSQQTVQQPQVQYHMQQLPYNQQILQQRQTPQIPFQQPPLQPMYHQPQTQMYQSSQMHFQSSVPQQQQQQQQQQQTYLAQHQQQIVFQQQRPTLPSVIHYLPNNTNQPTRFTQQKQQVPLFQTNGTDNITQQFLEQMHEFNLSDGNLNQTTTNSIQQPMTTNQVEKIHSLSSLT